MYPPVAYGKRVYSIAVIRYDMGLTMPTLAWSDLVQIIPADRAHSQPFSLLTCPR